MIEVEAPDGTVVEFPANTPRETIRNVMAKRFANYGDLSAKQAKTALERGEATLRRNTARMSEAERAKARARYEADPRVKKLKAATKKEGPYSPRMIAKGIGIGLGNLAEAAGDTLGFLGGNALGQTIINAAGYDGRKYDMGTSLRQGLGLPDDPDPMRSAVQKGAASALMFGGSGKLAANFLKPGTAKSVANVIGASPVRDAVAGGTAAGAAQFAEESGAGPLGQTGAALVGGLAGYGAASGVAGMFRPRPPAPPVNEVVKAGEDLGVPVMTSDVRPPRTFIGNNMRSIGEKIPFAGTAGPRAAQQDARRDAITTVLREVGGDDTVRLFDDAPTALDDVARSLSDKRAADLANLTAQKRTVIERNSTAPVPMTSALRAIDDQIAELTARGTKPALAVADELKSYRASLQGKTLDQIEAIRKDELSNAFKGGTTLADITAVGERAMRKVYAAVNDDMGAFIAKNGGRQDYLAWAKANKMLSAMAGDLNATTFKGVLRNAELTPERVGQLLFSQKRSDVARLYANLDDFGKARAQAAIVQRAFDKAISPDGGLSPERFSGNLKSLSASVGIAFKGREAERMRGLVKVLDATRRAGEATVAPATGVQNMPAVVGYSLGAMFGQAAIPITGIGGLLARAYESAPVRDALLKLGRAKVGTGAEVKALARATTAISASLATQERLPVAALNDNVGVGLAASDGEENKGE